jgi:cyanophycinase
MTGVLALLGGGEFTDASSHSAELDRRLIVASGSTEVVVMPTADAFEHPERLVARAAGWFEALGATASGLPLYGRADASDASILDTLATASFVYLAGDSPMHLRSALKDTPAWDALLDVLGRGGVIAASGQSAAALCDPMVDPRGGAFTLGLGLVQSLALVTRAETWSAERLKRTLDLAHGFTVASLPSGSAIVRTADRWELVGPVELFGGALPG